MHKISFKEKKECDEYEAKFLANVINVKRQLKIDKG
jgi:hypothetical protein